ncbi:MAG: SUMF1/EgtB/PvdO family nonheme iron enzyme [Nitrospirae bacterium]|nr:SUMF1/EgtB/PvdO family nonheme iron enzyme [Nitrospirota bacterium]
MMFWLLLLGGCYSVRSGEAPPKGMVLVPAGNFVMGASQEDGLLGIEVGVDQVPRHTLYLKAFYIDQYESTVSEYREFVKKKHYSEPSLWSSSSGQTVEEYEAVSDISSVDAEAYCNWRGKRLPTESEWEKAARGTDARKWPWGNEFSRGITNTIESKLGKIVAPGLFPIDRSPYGVYDMGGNVMEWTSSWYEPYPGNALKRDSFGQKFKILRGGTWTESANPFSRTTHRFPVIPTLAQPDFGVRCAKSAR